VYLSSQRRTKRRERERERKEKEKKGEEEKRNNNTKNKKILLPANIKQLYESPSESGWKEGQGEFRCGATFLHFLLALIVLLTTGLPLWNYGYLWNA
jgi:hypothetical protein